MYMFNESQKALKDKVGSFVRKEVMPVAQELDKNGIFPTQLIKRCGELGFVAPELMTDGHYRASEMCVIFEELARGNASLALALTPHYLACDIMNTAASPELKADIMEPAFALNKLIAYAISEESGGSDVLSINTTATQLGDEWVINGSKSWITASGKADGYLIAARTSLNSRSRDISLFYIDASTEGLEADIGSHMIGLNSCPTGHITFTNCRIPLGNIIGSENQGYTLLKPTLQHGRLAVSAIATGIAGRALELANNYSTTTGKYGRNLSSYQGIAFMLAEMYTKLAASRCMLYCSAEQYDAMERQSAIDVAATKLMSTELACQVCKSARQIHGANGLSSDFEVDRCFRDAQMLTIAEGTTEICKIIVSNSVINSALK